MSDLIWILDSEKGPSLGSSGVSGSYILPSNEISFASSSLVGKRLWVLLRGPEDRLLLLLKIKKVERIIDGYYTGDYLISPEITESVKLAQGYPAAGRFSTAETRNLNLGLSAIPHELSDSLAALVKSSVQTRLLPPETRLISKIDLQLLPHDTRRLAKSALRAVISHLTLEQVWARGNRGRYGPFSNFASTLLSDKGISNVTSELVNALEEFDPISVLLTPSVQTQATRHAKDINPPRVDTEFTEIVPSNIYAREFVSSNLELANIDDALNKTEHAEKVHQSMLKDISEFLIRNAIIPYESGSIDLMYKSGGELIVVEIKSANVNNVLSQAAKGAFQLACYLNVLSKDYDLLSPRLVIHDTGNYDVQNYASDALARLGIKVLIYKPNNPWPGRLQGMPLPRPR